MLRHRFVIAGCSLLVVTLTVIGLVRATLFASHRKETAPRGSVRVIYVLDNRDQGPGERNHQAPRATAPDADRKRDTRVENHAIVQEQRPKQGAHVEYHTNGQVKLKANYQDGALDGPYATFHNNGKSHIEATYEQGRLQGAYQESTAAGQLARKASYCDGKLHGWSYTYKQERRVSEQYYKDGVCLLPKSLDEIKRTLAAIQRSSVAVQTTGPLVLEQVEALRRLQAYRYLCGVPHDNLQLDEGLNNYAQAAARLCEKIGRLEHTPDNPGLPKAEYDRAYKGTSHSNLYEGQVPFASTVDGYMDDSDVSNIDRLGHRRWCLNPMMRKTGFGRSGEYSAMWAMDESQPNVPDYDVVSFPATGYMPVSYFKPSYAWSISLCPERYQPPALSVQVKVYRLDASHNKVGQPLELAFARVDREAYGLANCIIFQPKGLNLVALAPQRFWVDLEGVKDVDAKPTTVQFMTEFVTLD